MAVGALAFELEQVLHATPISGVTYSVYTEFYNTNWSAAAQAGISKGSVQKNTYNVYRLWILPLGEGQAISPARAYGMKQKSQAQGVTQAPPAVASTTQGWAAAPTNQAFGSNGDPQKF